MNMFAIVITALAVSSLGWAIYLIITRFKEAFDEVEEHNRNLIKDITEVNHDHPTPQQLVDFFNRPHR